MISCTDNTVLLLKLLSFSNRSLIIFSAGSMGTEVNNGLTSQDKTLSWEEDNLPNLIYKVTGTLYMMWWLAYKRFKYFINDLCHPISDRAPASYYWPKGGTCFVDLGQTIKLRGCATSRIHGPIHTFTHVSFPFDSSGLLDELCL